MRKLLHLFFVLLFILGLLCGCRSNNFSTGETSPADSIEAAASGYQPGSWTTTGYTSEWLNMSFKAPFTMRATAEYIEITKENNKLRRLENPNCEIVEMEFEWSNDDLPGTPAMLLVEPLTSNNKTEQEYADESENTVQNTYASMNIERIILHTYDKEVLFLGEIYLLRYTKACTKSAGGYGNVTETCSFYKIKDQHLVTLSHHAESSYFNMQVFLSSFYTLDTAIPQTDVDWQMSANENINEDKSNNPTPPENITPAQTIPMNETPYTTSLSASIAIYSKPDSTSSFVQNVGQDGIYTIVEEAYDAEGNLWGKLKSGLGWVLLKESSTVSVRTCPKCGQSEPDAIFPEDWKTGDPCFGCLYNSQGGGSDKRLICSQCGADCTFRGLEDDGRCEDCHAGNSSSPSSSSNNASQQPTSCSHSYANATCTTPQICTKCGKTSGTALGHKWKNITQIIHHEEQGHYEDVQDAKKVQKYRCWLCSYAQPTYTTTAEYYAHFDSAHGNDSNSSFFRERYEMVEDWVYETVTVWVVDQKAYTETVVTGRKCDVCGEKE